MNLLSDTEYLFHVLKTLITFLPTTLRIAAVSLLCSIVIALPIVLLQKISGGQQQRVAIARALAIQPSVILFDEPSSALDPELVGEVLETMKQIARDSSSTMIVVTHEIDFAREVADHVVFMDGGVLVEEGPPSEILYRPQEYRTRQFLTRILNLVEYEI